jgi:hypothetical protein
MFWRSKPKPTQTRAAIIDVADQHKKAEAKLDPEIILSEALSQYQTQYYEKVSAALDKDAEEAKRIVQEARRFIEEGRLAYSICRPVLEHVKFWPSWSKREGFEEYCNGPFRYISGSNSSGEKPSITVVKFSYNSRLYTLRLVDEGMHSWASDANCYGKLEFRSAESLVLGLDVSQDLAKGDLAHWWLTNVYAFVPGPWMKDLIEMAAHIDGIRTREYAILSNRDALERARNIKLP